MNLQETGQRTQETVPSTPGTLESWKEIAAYLQRDAKTARKWEKEEGLPIHRHSHKSRSSVYAYPGEIDRWRTTRKVAAEPTPPAPVWRRLLTPSFALTLMLCLVMVGNGVRPMEAESGQTRTLVCSGPECDNGKISPDGKSLLVHSSNGSLLIRDLATRKDRTIVEAQRGVRVCCPQFSPDGSRVAYSPTGPNPEMVEVVVTSLDGTKSRTVYRDGGVFAWSPDGKRLLIGVDEPGKPANVTTLAWVTEASGAVQKLPATYANLETAKVSPDGKFVAFNASKDGDAEENVYVMASDGSGQTVISPSAAYQEPVGWTGDGKYLVYGQWGASISLWAVPFANGKIQGRPFHTSVEFAKATSSRGASPNLLGLSRSGTLYYRTVSSVSDIYTATLDPATGKITSTQIPVPVPPGSTGGIVLPRWAPDSRRLAYMHLGPPREMYVFSFDTSKEERIAPEAKVPSAEHCWSRDGSSVFLNNSANGRLESERFDLATNRMTPMFAAGTPHHLANCSGNMVLGRTASGGIQVRSLNDSVEQEIYQRDPNAGTLAPVLSHDNRNVAFVTPGTDVTSTGKSVIHLVSTGGGLVRDLITVDAPAQIQPYWGVAWSADDRFLYFAQRANDKSPFELMRVPAAGGTAESMGLKIEDMRDLDISPDGKRIVFSIGAANRPEIWTLRGFLSSKN
jgi:Tol biopolymer transport system component